MNFWDILKTIAPLVLSVIPGVPPVIVPLIVHAMGEAEKTAATGAEKKVVALNIIQDGVSAANAVEGRVLIAPDVLPAVDGAIDAVVKSINAIQAVAAPPKAA